MSATAAQLSPGGTSGSSHRAPALIRPSASVAVLMAIASGVSLVEPGLYRDNDLVKAGWVGNDLVTLLVAVPGLVLTLRGAFGRSTRGQLVRMGFLAYAAYNYAFYLFGAAFNALFLVYAAVVALAIVTLGFSARELVANETSDSLPESAHRGVAVFTLIVVMALGGFWLAVSLHAAITGSTPAMVLATGQQTNLVAALDLSLIVPSGMLAGVWLWRRRRVGLILGAIWSVQAVIYMCALAAATVTAALAAQPVPVEQAILWGAIGVGCGVSSWRLLADFEPPLAPGR